MTGNGRSILSRQWHIVVYAMWQRFVLVFFQVIVERRVRKQILLLGLLRSAPQINAKQILCDEP
jgi:hypothetical protein